MTTRVAEDEHKKEQNLGLILTISDIQRLVSRMMIREVLKENLTLKQSAVLQLLANRGPVQMNQISRELLTTSANITSLIDRLEKKGLVQRVEDEKDRRKTMIRLTPDGKKLFETAAARYREKIQESFQLLGFSEREELLRLLAKVRDELFRQDACGKQPIDGQNG